MRIPRTDKRAAYIATSRTVDRDELISFTTGKHSLVLATTRADGRPQLSLVTGTITPEGEILISSYPQRAKVKNVRRRGEVSILVMGAEFNDEWVQVDGEAEVVDLPEALDVLVDYFRAISGEHPDWDEYRQAMADQGKCAIRVTPTRWGPVNAGGFPPELFEDE